MSSSRTDRDAVRPRRVQVSRDLVCGVVMLAVAALFLLKAGEVGRGKYDWLFPVALSYALAALAVILVVRGLLGRGERMSMVPAILRGQGVDVAAVSVLTVLYVALVNYVGFWIISGVTIFVGAVYLDTRRSLRSTALSLGVAIVACVGAYVLLTRVFYVNFPVAPWF